MFKLCVFLALVALTMAAPAPEPKPGAALIQTLPVIPASVSSQYINRNYNQLAAAPLAYAAYQPLAYSAYAAPYAHQIIL